MPSQVMSPSSASSDSFPRLTGAGNFDVWKARVRAALNGKGLLGFITHVNYDGTSEVSDMSEGDDDSDTSDRDDDVGSDSSLDPDASKGDSNDEDSESVKSAAPRKVRPFTETHARRQAKKKAPRYSSRTLRRKEAQTASFLMKTMDNTYVHLVKDKKSAYEIYQTIYSKYEGVNAHGNPYVIMSFLLNAKYKEGDNLLEFFLSYEDAFKALDDATGSALQDTWKSIFLYNTMPTAWSSDLQIWKGMRMYILYEELKRQLEAKVQVTQAEERYANPKGSPESEETKNDKALVATPKDVALPAQMAAKCTYCARNNHNISDCRVLQQDLRDGNVKAGTVLSANFAIRSEQQQHRYHPYSQQSQPSQQQHKANHSGGQQQQRQGNKNQRNGKGGTKKDYNQSRREHANIAVMSPPVPAFSLTANVVPEMDSKWTVDSECTRHVTSRSDWFTTMGPGNGHITVGGKNLIPIVGNGDVKMDVVDSKGKKKVLELKGVYYAPDLKFNLFSVPAVVKDDLRFSFTRQHCVINTSQKFTLKASIAADADLYQFSASTNKTSTTLVVYDSPKSQAVSGLDFSELDRSAVYFCTSCTLAKSHRAPFMDNIQVTRSKHPLQKVHTDICGPMPTSSLSGHRYFLIFIDDCTRFMFIYTMRNRNDLYAYYEDFRKKALNIFRNDILSIEYVANKFDPEIQVLQADNAKEYEKLGRIIHEKYGTHAQFTNAYTPEQNGVAERRMRTIMEKVRVLLFEGNLPRELWAECARHVCDLINMTPSTSTNNKTPYELWFEKKPSVQYLKVFGCTAYAHIEEENRDKLDPRAKLCMYIGVPHHKKWYRLMDVANGSIVYSRNVIFKEDMFPTLTFLQKDKQQSNTEPQVPQNNNIPSSELTPTPLPELPEAPTRGQQDIPEMVRIALKRTYGEAFIARNEKPNKKKVRFADEAKTTVLNDPEDVADENEHLDLIYTLMAIRYISEPKTFREAMSTEHKEQWLQAARDELMSHAVNNTWVLVPRPHGRKILRNRWVWVVKYNGTGDIDRLKARLVIKGFLQQYGIDYNEIFAPVIRMEVLRLLLTIAAILDFEIHQMDVKTAFLNSTLDEEIYMEQPEGFVEPGKEHLVCKLVKSLYGLKQAPRVWYQTLSTFLESIHFIRLVKDRCVFMGAIDNQVCYIAVYVDDLLIIAPPPALVNHIKSVLKQRFQMTDLGEAKYLLGWSIERDRHSCTIFIHQEKYATKVLDRFQQYVTHPVSTPLDRQTKLNITMSPIALQEIEEMKDIPYRELVGSFMYLMVGT